MHTVYGVALPKVYILVHFWQRGDVPKVGYFRDIPDEFKIKSLYSNDLILNIASKSKETVQKLKFLDSPIDSDITSGIRAATENPRRAKSTPADVLHAPCSFRTDTDVRLYSSSEICVMHKSRR